MKICFRPVWLFLLAAFLMFSACAQAPAESSKLPPPEPAASTPTPVTGPTSPTMPQSDPQSQELETFILSTLTGRERQHRYVIEVKAQDARAPLPHTNDVIQACWLYQDNVLQDCVPDDFVKSIDSESAGRWKYSYVIFSMITVNDDYSQATVRLDEISGPGRSQGILYMLTRENNQWEIHSQKILWTS